MSATQTTAPTGHSATPKGHRRPSKKPNHGGQNSRSVVSDNDAYTTLAEHNAMADEGKSRPRRKSHANKKGFAQSDAAAYSDGSTQRPASHGSKTHATPIKQQAYAGPTFHQSPAPSALPLPSFYSKSLPNASPIKARIDDIQSPGKPVTQLNQAEISTPPTETKRESTPLDFLFDAARKASVTPGAESPNHRQYLSSATGTPVPRSPAAREGDADFPFELDSGDQAQWKNKSAQSTPYRDRVEAARSQRTPSAGDKNMDEDERRAKTAALKQFLMNSAQNQGASVDNNPFNARSVPSYNSQHHHRSNPNSPYNGPGQANSNTYFPPMPPMPHIAHYQSPGRPGPPSSLRNVFQPESNSAFRANGQQDSHQQPRISTARDQTPTRSNFVDIYSKSKESNNPPTGHRANPSAQQLEDDLRKFLKLDLVSSG